MHRNEKIIVFFEDLNIRQTAVHYAAALAQRINAEIIFLLLLQYDSRMQDKADMLKRKYEMVILEKVKIVIRNNIPMQIEIRLGDRRSEFYKFMALHRSFHTAVWGGDESVIINRSGWSNNHWMADIKDELSCPFVIPTKKKQKE